MYSLLPDIIKNERRRKITSGEAKVKTQDNATQEKIITNNTEAGCLERKFCEPDDIYDGQISLGTKPGIPAEYICKHEAQLQAKETSLQEALNEVAKLNSRNNRLETAMMETRKNAYEAEEKARKKSQDLTIAKKAIMANNAQINNLQHRNEELSKVLSDTIEESDKTHGELTFWKNKYANDYNQAMRLGEIHMNLGADLFYQMTQLEVILANECSMFFFSPQDMELKGRACNHLTLHLACTTKQSELCELSMMCNANDNLPRDKWMSPGGIRLAIEAPPMNAETVESSTIVASEMEKLQDVVDQDIRVVDDAEDLESTNPKKSTPATKLRSVSAESSLPSPTEEPCSEGGRSDSATSDELEQESSIYEYSILGSIVVPRAEDSLTDDVERMQSLLGFNPNPEEQFYPQYEKASTLPVSNVPVEEISELQEPGSPNRAKELPIYTSYESATGPDVQSLLGYNPEPEEAFYPQYVPRNENEEDSTSTGSIQQDQEQTSAKVSFNEPIFDTKPEDHAPTTIITDSAPLTVEVSFADTSRDFKEEIIVRKRRADTSSTASTELEHQDTQSKTAETTPIFAQETSPTTTAPTSRNSSSSIDITFTSTSQPFVAGAGPKPRMSRTQRREAAMMKAQIEAMAAKQKADAQAVENDGGKMSRQERRAAERKAWKAALKQPRRNIVRF